MATNQKQKVRVKCRDPRVLIRFQINPYLPVVNELRYIWYVICWDYIPCMLAPNLWHCCIIRNPYPFENYKFE